MTGASPKNERHTSGVVKFGNSAGDRGESGFMEAQAIFLYPQVQIYRGWAQTVYDYRYNKCAHKPNIPIDIHSRYVNFRAGQFAARKPRGMCVHAYSAPISCPPL
jgi:hypothetical protein